jgi:LacI family transcriptional regulator
MREVADQAGVSVATVSNALNRPEKVAEETRVRIQQVIDDSGFIRNGAAAQLRGMRSPSVALVVLDIDNPFFAQVSRGAEEAANESNHLVILCNSGGERDRESRQLRVLEEQRVAGILMAPAGHNSSRLYYEIRRRGTPIVLLDQRPERGDQCCVAVDDIEGGRLAGRHLVELGHRRIALINGPTVIAPCVDRRAGFLAALAEVGAELKPDDDIGVGAMTIAEGEAAAARLLSRPDPPTAIFCTNDLLALGAEHAALAARLAIPHDIAIVGYDDVAFTSMAFVPLTTVRQPAYALGYRAAHLLLDEVANPDHHHEGLLFTPELVVRESTTGIRAQHEIAG